MARTPLDVYKGLANVRLPKDVVKQITRTASKFSDFHFAGQNMSMHLSRFLALMCRLIAFLEGRRDVEISDLPAAIDLLDYFTSTNKWWQMTRDQPGFIIRPASRDPRDFIKSLAQIRLGGATLGRINSATERFDSFLSEHEVGGAEERTILRDAMTSSWVLLCASSCKNQGQTTTTESDFEIAYDILRIVLFYTPPIDFRALEAVRRIARNPLLGRIASVVLSPGFEKQLESSPAALLEFEHTPVVRGRCANSYRLILTNSLRFLVQLRAALDKIDRVEAQEYAIMILRSLDLLAPVNVAPSFFHDNKYVTALLERLPSHQDFIERLDLIMQRIETLIADAQKKDFLLAYSKLVPRLTSLLLFLSLAASNTDDELDDHDLKKGLVLLGRLLSQRA
ncbi:MAG: hypothetical protein K9W43_00605 [Candidatus Thorarchaeota archaeon]|nr:hypothetical protein [Candidatus Thorarchaeota archaeon]